MDEPFNYESYWNMNPVRGSTSTGSAYNDSLANRYAGDMRHEDSFAAGVMRIPAQLKQIAAYAATGNMTKAKETYDQVNGFYADHAQELADAVSIDPKGNEFLGAIQRGALIGYGRQFDRQLVNTPQGEMPISDLFGPNGAYSQMRTQELQVQYFTKPTIDALNGDDEDLKSALTTLTDPLLGKVRPGETAAPRSQYVDLAHEVASFWRADVEDLGADGVRAAISHVKDYHLGDGTAVPMYRAVLANAKAQLDSGAESDPVQAVRKVVSAYESLTRRVAGGSDGADAPDPAKRMMATMFSDMVAASPDVNLDDPYVQNGLTEVMDLFAKADRAGVDLMSVLKTSGADFRKSVAGYVQSRGQGLPAPEDNLLSGLAQADQRLKTMLTPGWNPVLLTARANPKEASGTAAGVFGVQSTSPGLNQATVGIYRKLLTEVAWSLAHGLSEPEAFTRVMTDTTGLTVSRISSVLQDTMLVPEETAVGIAGAFLNNLVAGGQIVKPTGLEQAVADFAFSGDQTDSVEMQDARAAARRWYAANLGPDSRGFDLLLAGWDDVLHDSVVGFGTTKEGNARAEALKQQARQKMAAFAAQGLPAQALVKAYQDVGQYYYISGFRNIATGEVVDGVPEELKKAKNAKQTAALLRGYSPVLDVAVGDLDEAEQPYAGWSPNGLGVIPSFGRNSWSTNQRAFRAAQEQLQKLYKQQQEAMSKQMLKQAVEASSLE